MRKILSLTTGPKFVWFTVTEITGTTRVLWAALFMVDNDSYSVDGACASYSLILSDSLNSHDAT
jgi:hypothetical protein